MFDQLLVLADGAAVYSGPLSELPDFCASRGFPVLPHVNPADHIISLVNSDFNSGLRFDKDVLHITSSKANAVTPGRLQSWSYPVTSKRKHRRAPICDNLAIVYLLLARTMLNTVRIFWLGRFHLEPFYID